MQSQVRKTQIKKPYFGLQNDFFCGQVNVNKAALVWEKKARGRHSNQEKKHLTAKAA